MALFDSRHAPRVEVTKTGGVFTASVAVEGVTATRDPTNEELRAGIISLDPIVVEAKSTKRLIELCQRALGVAIASMGNGVGGPAGLLLTHYRTAIGVRAALRTLGEDI